MSEIKDFSVNFANKPINVQPGKPLRVSWKINAFDKKNIIQKNYRIVLSEKAAAKIIYDSGVVESGDLFSIELPMEKDIAEITEYSVSLSVELNDGEKITSETSFETCLRDESFTAEWIAQKNYRKSWAEYLRKTFTIPENKKIAKARAYFTGLGAGELYINGKRTGDEVFDPAMTNYELMVLYNCYDITDMLKSGINACGILLGDGWYSQRRAWGLFCCYGDPRAKLELHIFYEDGSKDIIASDESFVSNYSPITLNSVYGGETYDARLEINNWADSDFDDSDWGKTIIMPAPGGKMVPSELPPIRIVRKVKPVSVDNSHPGTRDAVYIYDMGENFSGFCEIKIPQNTAPGCEIVLRFSEDREDTGAMFYSTCGNVHTGCMQQDRYITKDNDAGSVWHPRFTYHGFRYVEVTGITAAEFLPEDFLTGYAVNTDLQINGIFNTDDKITNRFMADFLRTVQSNYHGYPEDCPVREKCGWLGDAQLLSDALIYNYDMRLCYEKYLEDIRTTKDLCGRWNMISPGHRDCGEASPLWGCAQVVMPWNMYLYYGDKTVLKLYYNYMKEWVLHELNRSEDYVISVGLGDWCPAHTDYLIDKPRGNELYNMPVVQSSTAEFFHVASLFAKIANIMDNTEDFAYFTDLAGKIKESFNRHFLVKTDNGYSYGNTGADGVAIMYGLVPENVGNDVIAKDFAEKIESYGYQMYTGIFCNKNIAPALTEYGYGDMVYEMFFGENHVNFKLNMDHGAASLWEVFGDRGHCGTMNHPMQGAFSYYYYRNILGIKPDENAPGFRHFTIKPHTLSKLTKAEGYYDSAYGRIAVKWKNNDGFAMEITIPAGTTADVILPNGKIFENLGCGDYKF